MSNDLIKLSYISRQREDLGLADMVDIEVISNHNNKKREIGGELIVFSDMFFQTIYGERKQVMDLYDIIQEDPRHYDVTLIELTAITEEEIEGYWGMNTLDMDRKNRKLLRPVNKMLQRISDTYKQLKNANSVLSSYTPQPIVEILENGRMPSEEPSRKVNKTILFTDIIGFSMISEALDHDEIVTMLNHYSEIVANAVTAHGGEIGKFLGDGILAYFSDEAPDQAIEASREILEKMNDPAQFSDTPLSSVINCGIGLDYGTVIEGNIGSPTRKDYTIIGDVVNTAAKLEAYTRKVNRSLLMTENVVQRLEEQYELALMGTFGVSSRNNPINIYTLNERLSSNFTTYEEITRAIEKLHLSADELLNED